MAKLVQYILIIKEHTAGWPLGAIVAQGCHAVTACMALYHNSEAYKSYTRESELSEMRKVVLESSMEQWCLLKQTLEAKGIRFYEWFEKPENVLTAVALLPGSQTILKPLISHLKLL